MTVLKSIIPRVANCGIMNFSTVIITSLGQNPIVKIHNPTICKLWHYESELISNLKNLLKPCNNDIMPHSPCDSSKNAILVPPKLSSDFDCCAVFSPRTVLEVLGQHFFQSHSENCGIIAHNYTPDKIPLYAWRKSKIHGQRY